MKWKRDAFCPLMVLLVVLCIAPHSYSATVRTPTAARVPTEKWNWVNPLDGAYYAMERFEDGVIVAIRHRMMFNEVRKDYERTPDLIVLQDNSGGPTGHFGSDVTYVAVNPGQALHDLWVSRQLSCSVTRTVSDVFGNSSRVCQLAPLNIKVENGSLSTAKGGLLWIITPTVTGSQVPAASGGQPTWGR